MTMTEEEFRERVEAFERFTREEWPKIKKAFGDTFIAIGRELQVIAASFAQFAPDDPLDDPPERFDQ